MIQENVSGTPGTPFGKRRMCCARTAALQGGSEKKAETECQQGFEKIVVVSQKNHPWTRQNRVWSDLKREKNQARRAKNAQQATKKRPRAKNEPTRPEHDPNKANSTLEFGFLCPPPTKGNAVC